MYFNPIVGGRDMRGRLVVGVLMVTACAAPEMSLSAPVGDLSLTLSRGAKAKRETVDAKIANRSQVAVCIWAELLQNPYSHEMNIELRKFDGRPIKLRRSGYVSAPIMDSVRIAPGKSVQGQYYVDTRFRLPKPTKTLPRGTMARVTFRYDHCDGSSSLQARSDWQSLK